MKNLISAISAIAILAGCSSSTDTYGIVLGEPDNGGAGPVAGQANAGGAGGAEPACVNPGASATCYPLVSDWLDACAETHDVPCIYDISDGTQNGGCCPFGNPANRHTLDAVVYCAASATVCEEITHTIYDPAGTNPPLEVGICGMEGYPTVQNWTLDNYQEGLAICQNRTYTCDQLGCWIDPL